jgi:hypothetical protein
MGSGQLANDVMKLKHFIKFNMIELTNQEPFFSINLN